MISDLEAGGSQRVGTALTEFWSHQGRAVEMVTVAGDSTDFFAVPDGVERHALDHEYGRSGWRALVFNNLERVRSMRSIIRRSQPDVVVSFLDTTNVLTILATRRLSVPVLVAERNDPRHQPIGKVWAVLRRLLYSRASVIVVQTESVRRWASQRWRHTPVIAIPNPVRALVSGERDLGLPNRFIAAVGRLTEQKGFDLLLPAFARARPSDGSWHLVIAGDGPDREELIRLVHRLGLSECVHLLGRVQDVGAVLSSASAFVLPSRFEGFPNALLEAMACGLPSVATDCQSGPGEIITDETDGLLVEESNVASLADALHRLMTDEELRMRLGEAAQRSVADRFSIQTVGQEWDRAITRALLR